MDVKATVKAVRNDFELHVRLVMKNESVSKSEAQALAYHEGRQGLNTRLNPSVQTKENKNDPRG